jgi:hypothetical protein
MKENGKSQKRGKGLPESPHFITPLGRGPIYLTDGVVQISLQEGEK